MTPMPEPSTPGCETCENGEPCIHCLGDRCDRYREALERIARGGGLSVAARIARGALDA